MSNDAMIKVSKYYSTHKRKRRASGIYFYPCTLFGTINMISFDIKYLFLMLTVCMRVTLVQVGFSK